MLAPLAALFVMLVLALFAGLVFSVALLPPLFPPRLLPLAISRRLLFPGIQDSLQRGSQPPGCTSWRGRIRTAACVIIAATAVISTCRIAGNYLSRCPVACC